MLWFSSVTSTTWPKRRVLSGVMAAVVTSTASNAAAVERVVSPIRPTRNFVSVPFPNVRNVRP